MRKILMATLAMALTILVSFAAGSHPADIDATESVSRVIDGDTFDVASGYRIRLADVDAPERGQPGSVEATAGLTSLIGGRTVLLDIDDVSRQDRYGRLVSVVYLRYNSTHLINVNKELLEQGLVTVSNFANEFDPTTWTLYSYHLEQSSQQANPSVPWYFFFVIVVVAIVAVGIVVYVVKTGRNAEPAPE